MPSRILCSLVLVLACACGTSRPAPLVADPTEQQPLPPASGTPIGILIDESSRLALRLDQLDRLREIDHQLATRNEHIASQLRELDRPPDGGMGPRGGGMGGPGGGGMGGPGGGGMGGPGGGGMGGPGGGGMGGGGMGPPGGGGGARGGGGRRPDGPPGPRAHGDPHARQRLADERLANLRDALDRAMALLDPDQRDAAMKLLEERGAAPAAAARGEPMGPPGGPPAK